MDGPEALSDVKVAGYREILSGSAVERVTIVLGPVRLDIPSIKLLDEGTVCDDQTEDVVVGSSANMLWGEHVL